MPYILNWSMLQNADIILAAYDDEDSIRIQKAINCKYTHAMLYVDKSIIEATKNGVFSCSPQRMLFNKKENVVALRCKGLTEDQKIAIVDSARFKIGTLYSWREACNTLRLKDTSETANSFKQFCSRLVAQAYEKAQVLIVNNSNFCSPKCILESKLLKEISGDYLYEATPFDLYVCNTRDLVMDHQKITYQWLNQVRELAEQYDFEIHCINHVFSFISRFRRSDALICQWIEESGYWTHYLVEREQNQYRFDPLLFIEFYKQWRHPNAKDEHESLKWAIASGLALTQSLIHRFGREYICATKSCKDTGFQIFARYHDMYRTLLIQCQEKLYVLVQVSSITKINHSLEGIFSSIHLIDFTLSLTIFSSEKMFNKYSRVFKCPICNITTDKDGNFFIPTTDDFEYDDENVNNI